MNDKARLFAKIGAPAALVLVGIVAHFEGTIYKTYRDPIGIITSCAGHTGPELKMGQTFTPDQCKEQLYADLAAHADDIDCIRAPLTNNQKAALISFSFNVGKSNLCGSSLVRLANAGNMPAACAQLSRWTYAGGKELPGLVTRRLAERELCETP